MSERVAPYQELPGTPCTLILVRLHVFGIHLNVLDRRQLHDRRNLPVLWNRDPVAKEG